MRSDFPPTFDPSQLTTLAPIPDAAPAQAEPEHLDTLMALINRCVDALHLMQERMSGLDDHARRTGELIARNKAESRADISSLRTRLKLAETNVEQMAIRLSSCEAGTIGVTATHARELLAARTEAETWRKRLESDLARLNGLESRLGTVENGLERRLEKTEADLAAANTSANQLRSRALDSEAVAVDLERKLTAAGSAIADQRARIACLQAKLAAATDTSRFADQTNPRSETDTAAVREDDVMDLAGLPEDRHFSAA